MKRNIIIFSLCILFFSPVGLKAQICIAGQHTSGLYFRDITPDTTVNAVIHYGSPPIPKTYAIDINGDHLTDFTLRTQGTEINSGSQYTVEIICDNSNSVSQTVFEKTVCCVDFATSFHSGDTIGPACQWVSDILLLAYYSWSMPNYTCSSNTFTNDSLGNYIGLRTIKDSDTTYGWVKVTNISSRQFTVQEYASTVIISGREDLRGSDIRIFPNPSAGKFRIEGGSHQFEFMVMDYSGRKLTEGKSDGSTMEINLEKYPEGLYFVRVGYPGTVSVHKIVRGLVQH